MNEESRRQWYAVRCCCKPQKILGFLPLKVPAEHLAQRRYSVPDRTGEPVDLNFAMFGAYSVISDEFLEYAHQHLVNQVLRDASERWELAIKSDDRPLEWWKTMPGFVAADHDAINTRGEQA